MRTNAIAMCAYALGALLAGCVGGQAQTETLVREVTIQGKSVVLERCRVRARSGVIAVGRCWRERIALPVVTRVERVEVPARCERPAAAPSPDRWRGDPPVAAAAITPGLRDALHRCAAAHVTGGSVRMRVVIDGSGAVSAIELDRSSPEMVRCATDALGAARFPPAARGTSFSMSLRAAAVDLGEVGP